MYAWAYECPACDDMCLEGIAVSTCCICSCKYLPHCKTHYCGLCRHDLENSGYYVAVSGLEAVVVALIQAVTTCGPARYAYTDTCWRELRGSLEHVPYYAMLVKMHKDPPGFRFLACNGKNGLKPIAVLLSHLFRSLTPVAASMWSEVLGDLRRSWKDDSPWFCTNSVKLVELVRVFSMTSQRMEKFLQGDGWKVWDVTRLYTNIDLVDLVEQLNKVLRRAWQHQLGVVRKAEASAAYPRSTTLQTAAIQDFKNKSLSAAWYVDVDRVYELYGYVNAGINSGTVNGHMVNNRAGYDTLHGKFHVYTLQEVQTLTKLLVENSYVQFEDRYYKQIRGIPMGINPAVFIANFYLFAYEVEFFDQFKPILNRRRGDIPQFDPSMLHIVEGMLQCATPADLRDVSPEHESYTMFAASELCNHFRWVKRFVDDVTCGPNPYLDRLLYTDQTVLGGLVHGIYPRQFLTLEKQNGLASNSPTLDVRILTSELPALPDVPGVAHSHTVLYAKHRLPAFRDIHLPRFVHVTSCMTKSQAYNMLNGRLCHMARIHSLRYFCVLEMARLLHGMYQAGYQKELCLSYLKKFLKRRPDVFGDLHYNALFADISAVSDLLGACPALISGFTDSWDRLHFASVQEFIQYLRQSLEPAVLSDMDISSDGGSDMSLGV